MLDPILCARIEERRTLPGVRVEGVYAITFEVVAARAGQPEIFPRRRSAEGLGDEMLDVQRHAEESFRRVAIAATSLGVHTHLPSYVDRDIGPRHILDVSGSCENGQGGKSLSTPFQQDGGVGLLEREQVGRMQDAVELRLLTRAECPLNASLT